MKKTQWTELFHLISKTKVTFIALVLFVTMGMALFFGIEWTARCMENASDDFFMKGDLADIDLNYVYGFDGDIVSALSEADGVEAAEGYYKAYEAIKLDGKTYEARITSLTEHSNTPVRLSGTRPQGKNEIAIEETWAKAHGIKIGDTITFTHDKNDTDYLPTIVKTEKSGLFKALMQKQKATDEDGMRYFFTDTFTVTALVAMPQYLYVNAKTYGISTQDSIPVSCLMFADVEAFDAEAFPGFTDIAVRLSGKDGRGYYDDEIKQRTNEIKDKLDLIVNAYTETKNAEISDKVAMLSNFGYDQDGIGEYPPVITVASDNTAIFISGITNAILGKLRYSMAGLFVLVGLLVCFFTVSRIVFENSPLIGAKKALGFTDFEVTRTYLLYAGAAALLGSAVGTLGAVFVVQPVILFSTSEMFVFDSTPLYIEPLPAVIFAVGEIAVMMATVYIACRSLFKKDTLQLLRGEETSKNKRRFFEKSFIWQKISLFFKTVINNFFNDKRRVFSTIIGVAACTLLVVCALTMNNDISGSFTKHYDEIFGFDGIVYIDKDADLSELDNALYARGIKYTPVFSTRLFVTYPDGDKAMAKFIVAERDDIPEIINLTDYKDKTAFDGGFWTVSSYGIEFGSKKGDTLSFTDEKNNSHAVEIAGFFDSYIMDNIVVTDADTFFDEFGYEPTPNTYYISKGNYTPEELEAVLSECEGFIYFSDDYTETKFSFNAFANVFVAIIAVYLALAVAMAFLVLYTLFAMFVAEKKRELLTLLANGYRLKDAKRYIYLDTVVLAVVGIALGTVAGTLMAAVSLKNFQTELILFLTGADITACLLGIAAAALLTAVTAGIALHKISKFRLTDVNS